MMLQRYIRMTNASLLPKKMRDQDSDQLSLVLRLERQCLHLLDDI
jgi:hypothetical protein